MHCFHWSFWSVGPRSDKNIHVTSLWVSTKCSQSGFCHPRWYERFLFLHTKGTKGKTFAFPERCPWQTSPTHAPFQVREADKHKTSLPTEFQELRTAWPCRTARIQQGQCKAQPCSSFCRPSAHKMQSGLCVDELTASPAHGGELQAVLCPHRRKLETATAAATIRELNYWRKKLEQPASSCPTSLSKWAPPVPTPSASQTLQGYRSCLKSLSELSKGSVSASSALRISVLHSGNKQSLERAVLVPIKKNKPEQLLTYSATNEKAQSLIHKRYQAHTGKWANGTNRGEYTNGAYIGTSKKGAYSHTDWLPDHAVCLTAEEQGGTRASYKQKGTSCTHVFHQNLPKARMKKHQLSSQVYTTLLRMEGRISQTLERDVVDIKIQKENIYSIFF